MQYLKILAMILFPAMLEAAPLQRFLRTDFDEEVPAVKNTNKNSREEMFNRARIKAAELKRFAAARGYSTERCFLMDMSISSGNNRFIVYNLRTDSVEFTGLVSHGIGSNTSTTKLEFSNEPGSYCTSLGRYAVGSGYKGQFGLAYKLFGLDPTNSKACDRAVVLHANDCVPDTEIAPLGVCESLGCPILSRTMLAKVKPVIESSQKKILLWIYE